MVSALILLAALLSAPAVFGFPKPSKNVPPQCVDPTFACQDMESARLCGVVSSCIHDIWSTMTAPDDNDEICDLCKEMVKEARDQLLSNMTQEEIKEVFEGSCKLLPVKLIADACIKLVDEFIPELVEMLASRMDPTMVCTVSGLCNLAHLPVKEKQVQVRDELVCEFCTHVLEHIKEMVTSNTTVEEFRTALLNFCKHTGSFSERCTELVNQYFDSVFDFIRNVDTKGFCSIMGLCNNQLHAEFVIPAVRIMPASEMRKKMPLTKLVPALPAAPNHESLLPLVKIQPAEPVKAHSKEKSTETNEIFTQSPEQLPLERFSHPEALFFQSTECAFCKAVAFFLEKDLHGDKDEVNVDKALETVCDKWVNEFPSQCKAFTSKYSNLVKHHIVSGKEFSAMCASVKACPAEEEEEKKGLNVKGIPGNAACDLCKTIFSEIEEQLKNPATKKSVEDLLDQLCSYLPGELQKDCQSFVSQNLDTLFNILEQELQADNICPALKLCPGYAKKVIPREIKDIECDLCKEFVKQLEKRLLDPDVKQSLRDLLDRGCSLLPTELANECKNFVDQNMDNLIHMLVQDMDPNLVCSALNLCPGSLKKTKPSKFKDIECDLCKEVVEKVDDELKDQRTEEEIREALDKVCSYLPAHMAQRCQTFVNEYSKMLIALLAEEMDPALICAALKICPTELEDFQQWRAKAKGLECESCRYFFHYVQNELMDSRVQEQIKGALEKVCKLLPSQYSSNCVAYIEEYGDALLAIVAQYLDPSTICNQLQVCSNSSPVASSNTESVPVKPLELDKCSLCTTVVDYLDKLLEEDDVDKEITELVEKVCNVIPASYRDRCTVLIQTYGPYLLQMIGQLADSKQVCQEIDMCPRPAGHVHLLGGKKCTFGPSYWCQSKVHAASCKAEEYCRSKVWGTTKVVP